ncbi:hypothetical protein [Nonomuraea sp. NPDC049784]|uniref:hypothetical protein n=1 Tax=Nonomuraea sp. NPDC049784 TaxID=3154361 RepID=UPI0033D956ED
MTLRACNQAANQVSQVAYEMGMFGNYQLRRHLYGELKAAGLSAQPAQHVIKKVADAYATLRGLIRNGRLGGPRSQWRRKAESKPIAFRPQAAQPFDDRCLSWQIDARTVSIWTVRGRLKNISFTGSPQQLKTLALHRRGESDLIFRDGMWLLSATCQIPEAPMNAAPDGWLGVDRGIVNLATTSDGTNYSGQKLSHYRRRMARIRAGHTERKNRPTRDTFTCRSCGFAGPADHIAALNVARRARVAWVFVNMPNDRAMESEVSASRAGQPDRTARRKPRTSALGR